MKLVKIGEIHGFDGNSIVDVIKPLKIKDILLLMTMKMSFVGKLGMF